MNGPEHYAEAERLLKISKSRSEGDLDCANAEALAAQVHATLALVAEQATRNLGMLGHPSTEWSRILKPPADDICRGDEMCTAPSHMFCCPSAVSGS